MSIIEPESDINLWISIISQSIMSPENLNLSIPSLKTVFTEVISDQTCLQSKYKISEPDFYRSIVLHILNPVLQLEKINLSKSIDSRQVFSELLNSFVNISILGLSSDDSNIKEIILLLFRKNNKLYQLDRHFFDNICNSFINSGYFNIFLDYIDKIPDSNSVPRSNNDDKFTNIANKIPFLVNSLISCIPYVEDKPDINWKSIIIKCMNPLIKLYRYLNDKIAMYVFCQIFDDMKKLKQIDSEIIKYWVKIFDLYLKTGNFSLILFTLSATAEIIKHEEFKNSFYSIFKQTEEQSEIIKLYLNVSIHEEFCKLLQDIYSAFLLNGFITIEDLSNLWKNQQIVHISTLPSFLSIFVSIASVVSDKLVDEFTDMILNTNYLTKEWLNCVVQIAIKLNKRKQNVSKYVNFFNQVTNGNFNFGQLSNNEIELFKRIAEEALPQLLTNSFDSQNYLSFLKSINNKIKEKQETRNDIEVLCNSLPNFNTGNKNFPIIQELFERIILIFNKYNIMTMKKIIELLISDCYSCTFNEQLIKQMLDYTKSDKLSSEIYSFITDLCIHKKKISIDLLLKVMVNLGSEKIDQSFYCSIKSIILALNDGCESIDKFPFKYENILWHFCFVKNSQIERFQKLLSRIYMKNTNSDKEMVESFISNSIKCFKAFYFQSKSENKSEVTDIFSNLLYIFLEKIESFIYVPFSYHFSEHKENKISIVAKLNDKQMEFDFDQRRSVSSLIHFIQITFKINNDMLIKYQNKELNDRNSIEEEIGLEILDSLKNSNKPLFLSFSIKKVDENNYLRQNRTFLPSLFIVKNIKGILDILFQSKTYSKLFYKLPAFNETIDQIKSLQSKDFQAFFPYDNPIKFQYNFESFLDFYSSHEFSLLDKENFDTAYFDKFVKKSGLIDYLINCGLSTSFPSLIHLILSFIKDFYSQNNESVINNEILGEQITSLIEGFLKPDKTSIVISNIFTIKIKSLPSLSVNLLYHLLTHKISSFRKEARLFLKDIEISLNYYGKIYDNLKYEPYEEFYSSMADHILLSKKRDDQVIRIIIKNCKKKNPYPAYLQCIDAALKRKMFNSKEEEFIANYIADNFITAQMECLPKYCFNEAMQISSYFQHQIIVDALSTVFDQFDFTDHLIRRASNENLLIDGDEIAFRSYARSFNEIKFSYEDFPIGLKNLGATCYINAVLQQLYNINDFRNELVNNEDSKNNLISSLNKLFYELQTSYLTVVDPSPFINVYGGINKSVQCDCCEFLQQLLNRLNVKIFDARTKNIISAVDDEQFRIESEETFAVFPLPIRNISNIDESFKHFLSADYFKNFNFANKRECDAKKITIIKRLPDHLIIQLKRFEFNHQQQVCEKISDSFKFDETFNIERSSFKLTGVIVHNGNSADSGHYISFVRLFKLNQWFEYNDSEVTRVDKKFVFDTAYKKAYILFYTKNDSQSFKYFNYKCVKDNNRYEIVCRMIFSKSFCNTMMQLCKNMNSSNYPIFKISVFYFFQLLPIYKNRDYQSAFGSILLSKCQESKENKDESFVTTLLYTIFEYWSAIKMESSLLYAEYSQMRRPSCDILKLVVSEIDCFEEISKMVQESNGNWFYYLYSSNEIFELIHFAFEKDNEKMIQISKNYNWTSLFENFIISVIQCKKINYNGLNLHFFAQIFVKVGFTDKFESAVCQNVQFILSLLNSSTPMIDIINIISVMQRKTEILNLLNGIKTKTRPLKELLSSLC